MGDRANFAFLSENGNSAIVLYGHYLGDEMMDTLARALDHSQGGWFNAAYSTRAAISFVVEDSGDTLSLLGFGLFVNSLGDNGHKVPVVDWDNQTVSLYPEEWAGDKVHPFIRGLGDTPIFTMPIQAFIDKFKKS